MDNIANTLTLLRVALIAPFLWYFYAGYPQVALALYVLASLTDWADGQIARRHRQTSEFGRFLDPIADKLLVTAALILLMVQGLIYEEWAIAAYLIIAREIYVSGLREFLAGKPLHVSQLGKLKTTAQLMSILLILLSTSFELPFWVYLGGLVLLVVAATLSVITAIDYTAKAMKALK